VTSDVTLTVRVLDANDHAPRFDVTSYRADVIENSFVGTYVTQVSAVDHDDGDNGLIHYILGNAPSSEDQPRPKRRRQKDGKRWHGEEQRRHGGRQLIASHQNFNQSDRHKARRSSSECVGRVNIDKDSGVVTVTGLIDYEYSSVMRCRILAIDSGSPPKTGARPRVSSSIANT